MDKAKVTESLKKALADQTPMDRDAALVWMRKSKQRHLHIIADYAEQKKLNFTTKGQWTGFIRRNVRAAQFLVPYDEAQLGKAYKRMTKHLEGMTHWTLETIGKYLDD